jgi:ankyrin repeat protein
MRQRLHGVLMAALLLPATGCIMWADPAKSDPVDLMPLTGYETLGEIKAGIRAGDDLSSPTVRHVLVTAAAFMRDDELLDLLRRRGVSIDERDPEDGMTPLHEVTIAGNVPAAGFLIDRNADLEAINSHGGSSPLYLAVCLDNVEMAQFLMQRGADPDHADRDFGQSPLHIAATGGKLETLRLLLDARAKPNATTPANVTPLHLAAQLGLLDHARLLIARGADINAHTQSGRTPLKAALSQDRTEMVAYLRSLGAQE